MNGRVALPTNDSALSWQQQLQQGIEHPAELLRLLQLDHLMPALAPHQQFKTKVPLSFVARMQVGNAACPLLRQVLPLADEMRDVAGFSADPLDEISANIVPGLLHKYHGRVLITLATQCAINCRYCFRRHFPYDDNNVGQKGWPKMLDYLRTRPDIHEVILSGGDPLMVPNKTLKAFLTQVEAIPSLKTLRIHTRLPIVLPARIDTELCEMLSKSRLHCVLVTHANHALEINAEVASSISALRIAGVHVLNQSVLLKGVNDEAKALIALSFALFEAGIMPYYLHVLDKVAGAAHFLVEDEEALALMQQIRTRLPGYLVPQLTREQGGEKSKLPLI